jgi:NADH-quinone oxidoreductase subunit J
LARCRFATWFTAAFLWTLAFAGLAAIFLQLNAEFVGFAQILVYVGAVAILIVFTILLTKNADVHLSRGSRGWFWGLAIAIAVGATIAVPILKSPSLNRTATAVPEHNVQKIGEQLMTTYVLPLEAIALLLTAALLGGVVIAMRDEPVEKVGRGVLTAPRPGGRIEGSDASPRRAEESAPYHEADVVVTATRSAESSSTP